MWKKFKSIIKAANVGQKLDNYLRYHGVKVIMLMFSMGIFAWDFILNYWEYSGDMQEALEHNKSIGILFLLIAFQVRGIAWEEKYRKKMWAQAEEIERLKDEKGA